MFKKIFLFFVLKYVLFYFLLMLINSDYSLFRISSLSVLEDYVYYFFITLSLPALSIVLFSWLVYLALKSDSFIRFVSFLSGVFLSEYFVYVYLTSQHYWVDRNGILNIAVGILLFSIFFFKQLRHIYYGIR